MTEIKTTDADFAKESESLVGDVVSDFNKARDYVKSRYQKVWEDSFKAYNGIRSYRDYAGDSDDFIPETFSIVESIKAAIAGSKPKFKYLPMFDWQTQNTDILNALIEYYWSCNNMTEKVLNWVGEMVIYGNGVLKVVWKNGRPYIRLVPLSDFFVAPDAVHLNRPDEPGYARYAGDRSLVTLAELKAKRVIDIETGDLISPYKNLDKIHGDATGTEDSDKTRKETIIGSTLGKDAMKNQVEIIDYYTRERHVMVANRKVVILDEETPYKKDASTVKQGVRINGEVKEKNIKVEAITGFLPYAILRNYVDSNLFYARGDVEVILPIQEALNDVSSQKRDNLAYVLNNMWQLDPRFSHLAEQIQSAPGAILPLPRGALTPLEKQDISSAADTEIGRLQQAMRSATAADAAVQGTAQRFSRTTATEVAAQLNQASMRFTTKVQNLEDEGFAQLGRILLKMIQIFVDERQMVRIVGRQGVEWQPFNPQDYQGEFEPRIVLESTADAETAALAQAMQVAAQFSINNPLVNQKAFLENMYKSLFSKYLSKDDIQEMLNAPQPIMGGDGNAVNPALAQSNPLVTPGGADALLNGGAGGRDDFESATQSGEDGGGGADSSSNNIRRTRAAQPSTPLEGSSRAR